MYYADKVVNFLLFLRRLQKRNKSSLCTIYGCDETPVWFENVGNCTINSVGARRITIRSTGHDKLRGTVMLAGKADYTRCRHIVMFKRIQPVQGLQEKFSNLVIAYSSNTRRNEELPHLYIGRVIGWLSFAPRLRVWNAYGWHVMDSTTSKVKSCQVAVIPGVCTKFLQPADISWNKNFKSKLSTLYDAWMERDEHEFSASGNICAPNRLKNMWMGDWSIESYHNRNYSQVLRLVWHYSCAQRKWGCLTSSWNGTQVLAGQERPWSYLLKGRDPLPSV